jgi:hypothetical protein
MYIDSTVLYKYCLYCTYLVFLLQMSRAQTLEKPVRLGRQCRDHVIPVRVGISVVRSCYGGTVPITGSDRFSLEIDHILNHFPHVRDHHGGGHIRLHERGHGLARVVHVLDVRATKGGSAVVDGNGVSVNT